MSTYVVRKIEYRAKILDKVAYIKEDIIDPKEGCYYLCYGEKVRYLQYLNGEFIGVDYDDIPFEWKPVKIYCDNYKESRSGFSDNGGTIRDLYLSKFYGDKYELTDRGFPSDMCQYFNDQLNSLEHIYNKTYVMLSEWTSLFDKEYEKFKYRLYEEYKKKNYDSLEKHLIEIKELIRDKYKRFDDVKDVNVEEIDELEYIWDGVFSNLMCIDNEISRIKTLVNVCKLYIDDDDIRIIYYFE